MTQQPDPKLEQLREKILKVISGDHWESTRFLRVIKKKFSRLLDDVNYAITGDLDVVPEAVADDQQMVYISLYHRGGLAIADWESVLTAFSSIAPGRQIFMAESEAQEWVMKTTSPHQQAYIELGVGEDDFLTPSTTVSDSLFQHRQVLLKTAAYDGGKIRRFVHMKQSYSWSGGKLHKIID